MADAPFAAEQPLYDVLDAHRIDFRASAGELMRLYDTRPTSWSEGLAVCEISDAEPLIDGAAGPIQFNWVEAASVSADMRPRDFHFFVRQAADTTVNFAWATQRLERLLGPGDDVSVSNTRELAWQFGDAAVVARVFPPELQDQRGSASNSRHAAIEGAATECRVTIHPAWVPLPNPQEFVAIESYVPITSSAILSDANIGIAMRWYDTAANGLQRGFGFDPDAKYLVKVAAPNRVTALAVELITEVRCDNLLPARGSGGSRLSVGYGLPAGKHARLYLAGHAKPGALGNLANDLGARLGVPVTTTEYPDD